MPSEDDSEKQNDTQRHATYQAPSRLLSMRRLVLAVVLLSACTEDAGGGPSFGSGASGANPASTTAATSADGSSSQGEGGSTTSESGEQPTTTGHGTDGESSASTEPTSASDPTTGTTPTTSGDPTGDTSTGDGDASESGGTALDPDLDVPDEGESCTTPGSMNECAGISVCRFYTAEEGRCESCDACGNLNAPCTEGTDCDILFACYAGRCTNICQLGTFGCGPIEDCLDVGHATHGVCDPFA